MREISMKKELFSLQFTKKIYTKYRKVPRPTELKKKRQPKKHGSQI